MKFRIIIMIFFPIFAIAQAPQKINFQSILRNSLGEVIGNKSVSLKITMLSGSINGSSVYSETHAKTTDASGLISLQIGNGTLISGIFANIDWGGASHFIKLEADFSGGSNYVVLGTQELMSVPYAMYATKTDTSALNLTSRMATKLNAKDTVSLSNRINANSNSSLSDTSLLNLTSRLATKLNVTDTASLSNRIDLKLTKTDTASLSNRIDLKLNRSEFPTGTNTGNILYWNGTNWVNLAPGQNGQALILVNGIPTWSNAASATAPTGVVATSGNSSASVAFVAPTNNGGSSITGYTVTSNPGGISVSGNTSPINVTGLTNGTAYTFTVVATNAVGSSVASSASTAVTPATVPSSPTGVVATAGNTSASIAFVAPTNNGGSSITGYTVTSNPGNISVSSTTSPINVTGLTNGAAYTFTVLATNGVGSSVASSASTAVTPATVPSAPTSVVATAGNSKAEVAFVAPASNGGSAITSYTVTSNPNGINATGSTSPINVTGLNNGTSYTFTVVATNSVGSSVASVASIWVLVSSGVTTVPSAPTSVVATAGNSSASVAFVAPDSNGGSSITGYTVTPFYGFFSLFTGNSVSSTTSPINVTGLTNGTSYTFKVVATNSVGNSAASTASSAVIPSFSCGTHTVSDIDGNIYNTVLIANQCWMKENLKTSRYSNGVSIPIVTDASEWVYLTTGGRSWYDNDSTTYENPYGNLYNWHAVADSKGLCPAGWGVPTDDEWTTLTNSLGGESLAGSKMKSTGTTYWVYQSEGTDNSSGFSALPGGYRSFNGSFYNIRRNAFFWSATEYGNGLAWNRYLTFSTGIVNRLNYSKSVVASVRCLRD